MVLSWLLGGSLVCATAPFLFLERRWRGRWREVEIGRLPVEAAASLYRAGGSVPDYLARAPRLVRAAAWSCLFCGQMFAPAAIAGIVGMLACGLGVIAIPGLVTAAKLYGAGLGLLRRDAGIYWKVREASLWSLWVNAVLGVLALAPLLVFGGGRDHFWWHWLALLGGYALFSIAQALFCLLAIRRWEDALFQPSFA